jgi:hypothetical protein
MLSVSIKRKACVKIMEIRPKMKTVASSGWFKKIRNYPKFAFLFFEIFPVNELGSFFDTWLRKFY